jgi:hypothetical protein
MSKTQKLNRTERPGGTKGNITAARGNEMEVGPKRGWINDVGQRRKEGKWLDNRYPSQRGGRGSSTL